MVELNLTKRQKEIFDFIRKYAAKTGYPPTVREIGKAVGLHSSSTVHAHLANLEKIGLLKRDPSKPRAIELLDRATAPVVSAVEAMKSAVSPSGIPVLGRVAAEEGVGQQGVEARRDHGQHGRGVQGLGEERGPVGGDGGEHDHDRHAGERQRVERIHAERASRGNHGRQECGKGENTTRRRIRR